MRLPSFMWAGLATAVLGEEAEWRKVAEQVARAEVTRATAAQQAAVEEMEKTLERLEREAERWRAVYRLDENEGKFDPATHAALARIESIVQHQMATEASGQSAELDALENQLRAVEEMLSATSQAEPERNLASSCIDKEQAMTLVDERLDRFAADTIARPDFALAAAGGTVERRRGLTSPTFAPPLAFNLLAWMFPSASKPAEAALDSSVSLGDCWACSLTACNLTVRLPSHVQVSAVSLDHVSRHVAMDISSAPKRFNVYGLRALPDRAGDVSGHETLGSFEYDALHGSQVQTFPIAPAGAFSWVKFEMLTNHGHKDWTCVYRVRVHGTAVTAEEE